MLLPKKTFVALAGQNAWHICTGVALPRVSGKYFPSQLRTQKAGPLPEAAWRGGGAGCWLRPNGSAKKLACGAAFCCCCFGAVPKKKSKKPSADAMRGASATEPASAVAATSIMRRRMRRSGKSLRNAYSTPTQQNPLGRGVPQPGFTLVRDGKRGMSKRRTAEKKCSSPSPACVLTYLAPLARRGRNASQTRS